MDGERIVFTKIPDVKRSGLPGGGCAPTDDEGLFGVDKVTRYGRLGGWWAARVQIRTAARTLPGSEEGQCGRCRDRAWGGIR